MSEAERRAPEGATEPSAPVDERFWRTLLETIDVGIVACDAQGRFLLGNKAERDMFGLVQPPTGSEIPALDAHIDVFDPQGRRLSPREYPLARALAGEVLPPLEVVAGPRGGPYRDLLVRAKQILDGDGNVLGAVAALNDVSAEKAAGRRLSDEHRRLNEAQRVGRLGSFEYDFGTNNWVFSDNLAQLWGVQPGELTPEALVEMIGRQTLEQSRECWAELCANGGAGTVSLRAERADGAELVIRCTFEVELGPDGKPVRARGTHLDITDLDKAQRQAERSNAFFMAILSASPDFMFVVDIGSSQIIYVSPGKELLGLEGEQFGRSGLRALANRASAGEEERLVEAVRMCTVLDDGGLSQAQFRARHENGSWRWLSVRATPFRRGADGAPLEALCVVRDVTELVDAEERLVHAARHDYLTGLPNRSALVDRLDATLEHASAEGREVAVLFCDLDGFKAVNDTGGHAVGDALLLEVAERLLAVVRDEDVVARVGGDEFVIVVEPWNRALWLDTGQRTGEGKDLGVRVADRVVEALRPPVYIGEDEFYITTSIGIACAKPAPTDPLPLDADLLLHMADIAMYRAKEQGKDQYQVLDLGTVARAS
ncbi:MAG TPA: diguanylate cyclase [Acidimicrobiales bacterium]|nr:diguanylate cyclase [Acidimicrobiales bacterium]